MRLNIQIYVLQMIHSPKKKKKSFFKIRNGWLLEFVEGEGGGEREKKKKQRRVPARFNAVATAARRHKFPLFRKLWKGTEQNTEKDHVRKPDIFSTNDFRKRHAPCHGARNTRTIYFNSA